MPSLRCRRPIKVAEYGLKARPTLGLRGNIAQVGSAKGSHECASK